MKKLPKIARKNFLGEALKKEEVKRKKSDFFKLGPLIKIQKEEINKEENEGSLKEMETNSNTDFKSQLNPKLKVQEVIDKGNFFLDPRILVQRELEGVVLNPSGNKKDEDGTFQTLLNTSINKSSGGVIKRQEVLPVSCFFNEEKNLKKERISFQGRQWGRRCKGVKAGK